jgi:hypothetical protein
MKAAIPLWRRREQLGSRLPATPSSSAVAWPPQPASAPDNGGHEIVDRTLVSSYLHHFTDRAARIPTHVATAASAIQAMAKLSAHRDSPVNILPCLQPLYIAFQRSLIGVGSPSH